MSLLELLRSLLPRRPLDTPLSPSHLNSIITRDEMDNPPTEEENEHLQESER